MSDVSPGAQAPATPTESPNQPVGAGTPQAGAEQASPTKSAAQEAMRKFKVKVDGQEQEVDEAELLKGYTHGKAAARRMQEGQKAKAQAEQFLQMMRDPSKVQEVMTKLGYTRQQLREMSEKLLSAELEEEMMDPKDRELKSAQARLKAYEESETKRKEDEKKQEHDRLKSKFAKEFQDQFIDALKISGLPQTKEMVAEMAKYIKRASVIGYKLAPQDAAKFVREDEEARFAARVGSSEADVLAKMLGDDNLKKLREYDAKKIRDPNAHIQTPQEQPGEVRPREKNSRMTHREWRNFNRPK